MLFIDVAIALSVILVVTFVVVGIDSLIKNWINKRRQTED